MNRPKTTETATKATFDLAAYETAETATLEPVGVDGKPLTHNGLPVRITLYGPGTEVAMRAEAKSAAASQARAFAALRGTLSSDDLDEERRQRAEKLAAVTVSIENFPIDGGAMALYTNPRLRYITNQVERFAESWANFKPGCATA